MTVFNKIRQWAEDRNLVEGSSPASQMLKLTEELGELANAINKNKKTTDLVDSIGDVTVVLTIIAQMYGFKIEDCANHAYIEIKDRKGRMVNGTFVKESDLDSPVAERNCEATKKLYYKAYTGSCEYSAEDKVYHGKLLSVLHLPIEECWTYEAKTKDQLYTVFCSTVDDYVEFTLGGIEDDKGV